MYLTISFLQLLTDESATAIIDLIVPCVNIWVSSLMRKKEICTLLIEAETMNRTWYLKHVGNYLK